MEYFIFLWVLPSAVAAWIASSKGRSGGAVFFLSLLATPIVGVIVALSMKRKSKPARTLPSAARHRAKRTERITTLEDAGISMTVSTSYDDDLADDEPQMRGKPSKIQECWIPKGKSITVQGYEIPDGMVYVGKNLSAVSSDWRIEPALIDPALGVNRESPDHAGDSMGYWPQYTTIDSRSRAAYLEWLAGCRSDPNAYIGYVFLFFYGLERRALADINNDESAKSDLPAIIDEVNRLVLIYGDNGSFRNYARGFLDFVSHQDFNEDNVGVPPRIPYQCYELPVALKVPLGHMAKAGVAMTSEWALTWLHADPEFYLRTPATRCVSEFDELFKVAFDRKYPNGMKLKDCKRRLKFSYRPASSSFAEGFVESTDLPAVTSLVGPRRALQDIANWCADELDSYSRWLGRNPDKKDDLAGAAMLPEDLLIQNVPSQVTDLKHEVEQRLHDKSFAVMAANDVLEAWLPIDGSKQSKKTAVEGARLLERIGIGVEPDVRFGGPRLSKNEEVVVFKLSKDDMETASPQYTAATVLMQLATMVSAADGEISEEEETILKDYVAQGLQLAESEQKRLSAHLQWLLRNPPSDPGPKKRLEVVPATQREAVGRFLVSVAWADGHVDPGEVKSLAKIYRTLGLNADIVHQHIHEIRSASDFGPVTVVPEDKPTTYKIPAEKPAGVKLDKSKISAMQKESLEVSRIIGEIFADDDDQVVQVPVPQEESTGTVRDLDTKHSYLFVQLGERDSWTRSEYENLVEGIGLFPDGALEILNEVAYDVCDEPLTDGEDPITINKEVYREVAN